MMLLNSWSVCKPSSFSGYISIQFLSYILVPGTNTATIVFLVQLYVSYSWCHYKNCNLTEHLIGLV